MSTSCPLGELWVFEYCSVWRGLECRPSCKILKTTTHMWDHWPVWIIHLTKLPSVRPILNISHMWDGYGFYIGNLFGCRRYEYLSVLKMSGIMDDIRFYEWLLRRSVICTQHRLTFSEIRYKTCILDYLYTCVKFQ